MKSTVFSRDSADDAPVGPEMELRACAGGGAVEGCAGGGGCVG